MASSDVPPRAEPFARFKMVSINEGSVGAADTLIYVNVTNCVAVVLRRGDAFAVAHLSPVSEHDHICASLTALLARLGGADGTTVIVRGGYDRPPNSDADLPMQYQRLILNYCKASQSPEEQVKYLKQFGALHLTADQVAAKIAADPVAVKHLTLDFKDKLLTDANPSAAVVASVRVWCADLHLAVEVGPTTPRALSWCEKKAQVMMITSAGIVHEELVSQEDTCFWKWKHCVPRMSLEATLRLVVALSGVVSRPNISGPMKIKNAASPRGDAFFEWLLLHRPEMFDVVDRLLFEARQTMDDPTALKRVAIAIGEKIRLLGIPLMKSLGNE